MESQSKLENSVMEFKDLRDWWRYIENNLPQANKIGCEFARIVDKDIKLGRQCGYKKGDIVCAFMTGVGYFALGGFLGDNSYCYLHKLRYSEDKDAILEGKCYKLEKFIKIYK